MSGPGSFPTNLHQGGRSEYFVNAVFSALGSIVQVPRQEDTGIDHHCTITEDSGGRSTPALHYDLQVKSHPENGQLTWAFPEQRNVDWLINHPKALFVCSVDKSKGDFRLYSVLPRFEIWCNNNIPSKLTVHFHDELFSMNPGILNNYQELHINSPILRFNIGDISSPTWVANARRVMGHWITFEDENIWRKTSGYRTYAFPWGCNTNKTPNIVSAQRSSLQSLEQLRADAKKLQTAILGIADQLARHQMYAEATLLVSGLGCIYAEQLLSGDDGDFCAIYSNLLLDTDIALDGMTVGQSIFKLSIEMKSRASTYLRLRHEEVEMGRLIKTGTVPVTAPEYYI